jgi:hypothetical protein
MPFDHTRIAIGVLPAACYHGPSSKAHGTSLPRSLNVQVPRYQGPAAWTARPAHGDQVPATVHASHGHGGHGHGHGYQGMGYLGSWMGL